MGKLCSLLSVKYKWREELYDMVFALGVAFTNVHLGLYSLQADDIECYNRYNNRLNALGEYEKRKRNETQENIAEIASSACPSVIGLRYLIVRTSSRDSLIVIKVDALWV